MADTNLTMRLIAVASFGLALFGVNQIDADGVGMVSGLAAIGLVLGAALVYLSPEIRTFTASRAAMGPWILAAGLGLSGSSPTPTIALSLLGGFLVGASLGESRIYSRMVPALGLPLIVGQLVGDGEAAILDLLPWMVSVGVFAMATNHIRFDITPPSLDPSQPGLVHRPKRLVQVGALITLCVVVSISLTPLINTPNLNFGISPLPGDLGGIGLNEHPGLKWGELDTGRRVTMGEEIVLRVRAERPDYWRQLTYDTWDGRTWTNPDDGARYIWESDGVTVSQGRPGGETTKQQFTLMQSGMDVVPGAYKIQSLYSTGRAGLVGQDGSITLEQPMGAGARWTVYSSVRDITPESLRKADPVALGVSELIRQRYVLEADVTPRVRQLALEITQDQPTTYDKISALEDWMDENIHYSRQIATLPEGADAVEQLLLVDQLGYCEQIGTSLVVMLRSLGIPARLVIGYVPGEYDEKTDEWISRASDAHAWAEVYFPGVGWQGFDPTAGVPLSGEEIAADLKGETAPDWNLIGQVAVGVLGVLLLSGLVSNLAGRRRVDVAPRLARLNAVGKRLQRDWSDSMTIREKAEDLIALGLEEEVVTGIATQLEHASYSGSTGPRLEVANTALDDLEAAVDHFLKVPK